MGYIVRWSDRQKYVTLQIPSTKPSDTLSDVGDSVQ